MKKVPLYLYWISAYDNHTNEMLRFSAIAPNKQTALKTIYEAYPVSNGTGRRIKYVSSGCQTRVTLTTVPQKEVSGLPAILPPKKGPTGQSPLNLLIHKNPHHVFTHLITQRRIYNNRAIILVWFNSNLPMVGLIFNEPRHAITQFQTGTRIFSAIYVVLTGETASRRPNPGGKNPIK